MTGRHYSAMHNRTASLKSHHTDLSLSSDDFVVVDNAPFVPHSSYHNGNVTRPVHYGHFTEERHEYPCPSVSTFSKHSTKLASELPRSQLASLDPLGSQAQDPLSQHPSERSTRHTQPPHYRSPEEIRRLRAQAKVVAVQNATCMDGSRPGHSRARHPQAPVLTIDDIERLAYESVQRRGSLKDHLLASEFNSSVQKARMKVVRTAMPDVTRPWDQVEILAAASDSEDYEVLTKSEVMEDGRGES